MHVPAVHCQVANLASGGHRCRSNIDFLTYCNPHSPATPIAPHCSSHTTAGLRLRFASVTSSGCVSSRIAATISGARVVRLRNWATKRSSTPSFLAICPMDVTLPSSCMRCQRWPRARADLPLELGEGQQDVERQPAHGRGGVEVYEHAVGRGSQGKLPAHRPGLTKPASAV